MDYIQLLQNNIKNLSENEINNLLFDEFFKLEDEISDLNLKQIEQSKGFDYQELDSNTYNGTYSENTQAYADLGNPYPSLTRKPKGEKYNFLWSGNFAKGFGIRKEGDGIETYSNGAYSTTTFGKTAFFQSYNNMFGLNEKNTITIESEVMYYVLEKIILKIYK
jgi:hypothetical protein